MVPGRNSPGESSNSNSRDGGDPRPRQAGVKRPRPGVCTGAPRSDAPHAMAPPRPKTQQQGQGQDQGQLEVGPATPTSSSSASTPHPHTARSSPSNRGKSIALGLGLGEVWRARRQALPAISSALFDVNHDAKHFIGKKRGRACNGSGDGDGGPAAQQGNRPYPSLPPRRPSSNNNSTRDSDSGSGGGGGDDGGSASGTHVWTASAVTVSRVLQLGHGATATRTPLSNVDRRSTTTSNSTGEGSKWSPQGEIGGSSVRERESGAGGGSDVGGEMEVEVEVLVGVLAFESLREGNVAVSSLFLQDETGRVRLICVPPPPPCWVGEIVCVSRWTLSKEKEREMSAAWSQMGGCDGSDSPLPPFPSSSSSTKKKAKVTAKRLSSFTACLEVAEMFHVRQHEQKHQHQLLAGRPQDEPAADSPGKTGSTGDSNHNRNHYSHNSGAREDGVAACRNAANDSVASHGACNKSGGGGGRGGSSSSVRTGGPKEGEGGPSPSPARGGDNAGRERQGGEEMSAEVAGERESEGTGRQRQRQWLGSVMALGWSCVRRTEVPRPPLAEVIAQGALGLEAFVGRKGRGPFDVVARVAAVSPVVRFKNASPFFMVEVEQAEKTPEHQPRRRPPRQQHPRQQRELPRPQPQPQPQPSNSSSSSNNTLPPPSPSSFMSSPPKAQPSPRICRSPEEILALFSRTDQQQQQQQQLAASPTRAAECDGQPNKPPPPPVAEHAAASAASAVGGDDQDGKACVEQGGGHSRPPCGTHAGAGCNRVGGGSPRLGSGCGGAGSESRSGRRGGSSRSGGPTCVGSARQTAGQGERNHHHHHQQQPQQLSAMLVLNGPRCLPWHAFLVPGKTFVFPAVGAFVLGGSRGSKGRGSGGGGGKQPNTYRAFGDAGTAVGGSMKRLVEVDAFDPSHHGQDDGNCDLGDNSDGGDGDDNSDDGHEAQKPRLSSTRGILPAPPGAEATQTSVGAAAAATEAEATANGEAEETEVPVPVRSSKRRQIQSEGGGGGIAGGGGGFGCGGGYVACQCVLTYEGKVSGIAGQAGTYILDGGKGGFSKGINLYLQHLNCSSLGAGLRRGATIRVHNVHPVYASCGAGRDGDRDGDGDRDRGDRLIGLGGCLRTTVQVVRLSPLGGAASYRPLTGGATNLPLAVHAWRHAFGAAFSWKELPGALTASSPPSPSPSPSPSPWGCSVDTAGPASSSSSASCTTGLHGGTSAAMDVVRGEDEGKGEAAWVVEWEESVCRWVFGRDLAAMGLPKRDVYAEFLNHPTGVCAIVDLVDSGRSEGCGCGLRRSEGYSKRGGEEGSRGRDSGNKDDGDGDDDIGADGRVGWFGMDAMDVTAEEEEDDNEAKAAAAGALGSGGLPLLIQRADEGWHGDPVEDIGDDLQDGGGVGGCSVTAPRSNTNGQTQSSSSSESLSSHFRPTPAAVLRAAARPLSDSLEVAVQHALDSLPPVLLGKPGSLPDNGRGERNRSAGAATAAETVAASAGVTTATYTVRTAFGSAVGREDGLLGWLHHDHRHLESVGDSRPVTAATGVATGLSPLPTLAPTAASRRSWWIGDRTARAQVVMIARWRPKGVSCPGPSGAHSVGSATVLAASGAADVAVGSEVPTVVGDGNGNGDKGLAVHAGEGRAWSVGVHTLALVRRFAVCTEVVILGPASASTRSAKRVARVATPTLAPALSVSAPPASASASASGSGSAPASASGSGSAPALASASESVSAAAKWPTRGGRSGGSCSAASSKVKLTCSPPHVLSKERHSVQQETGPATPTPSEVMRVVDGVRVLLRSYLVVDVDDMSVLPRRDSGTIGSVGSIAKVGEGGTANESSSTDKAERDRSSSKHRAGADGSANLGPKQDQQARPPAMVRGGCEQAFTSRSMAPADGQKQRRPPEQRGHRKPPPPQQLLSVCEALVVRLAGNGTPTPTSSASSSSSGTSNGKGKGKGRSWGGSGGKGGGPKLHPCHEREAVTVRGVLREVGFRVLANGGGDAGRREVSVPEGKGKGKDERVGMDGSSAARRERGLGVGGAAPSTATATSAGASRGAKTGVEVDMFEALSRERVQLCLTLAEGADRISVYLAVRAGSWPVGMMPGFSTVQVEGVCRRLSGNGKSVYLALARAGGGTVRVLSLALPPPPEVFPVFGWSNPSAPTPKPSHGVGLRVDVCNPARAAQENGSGSTAMARHPDGGMGTDPPSPSSSSPSFPLILFPRPRAEPQILPLSTRINGCEPRSIDNSRSSRNNNAVAAARGGGVDVVAGFPGGGGATAVVTGRGRGVVAANRGGRPLLLDTHPAHAPPSPTHPTHALLNPRSSSQPPLRRPPSSSASSAAACQGPSRTTDTSSTGASVGVRGDGVVPAATDDADVTAAGAASVSPNPEHTSSPSKERVRGEDNPLTPASRSGADGIAVAGTGSRTGPVSAQSGSVKDGDDSGASTGPCSESSPTGAVAVVAAAAATTVPAVPTTLGSMCKRGVLVRASRKMSCLSVVGIRFAKAAMWCNNCGLVREKDLSFGRCWARCDAQSSWEVRWEGSANVDDGTAQALLLLDGDDVVKLLKLSSKARKAIEAASRLYGPVSFSGHAGGNNTRGALASAAGPAPPPALAQARKALEVAADRARSSFRGGSVSARCMQTIPRGGGGGSSGLGAPNGAGRQQASGVGAGGGTGAGGGGYGSAVVDVMGEGMETLTLPKLVLQGGGLEEVGAREEAYGVLARLGEL